MSFILLQYPCLSNYTLDSFISLNLCIFLFYSCFRKKPNRSIYYSVIIECNITDKNDGVVFGNFRGQNHLHIVYIWRTSLWRCCSPLCEQKGISCRLNPRHSFALFHFKMSVTQYAWFLVPGSFFKMIIIIINNILHCCLTLIKHDH